MKTISTNQFLSGIINTMHDGLALISPEGRILMVNDALERMTGYARHELVGHSCLKLGCDACVASRAEGEGHWCRLFRTQQEHRRNCYLRHKQGAPVHVLKNASLLYDEQGHLQAAVETLTDISEIDRRDETIEQLSRLLQTGESFHGMVGNSPVMQRVYDLLRRAAASDAPVIIYGESGTGKELVARALHTLGSNREGPFVQVNCAALSESLLESEMFGHARGAFTGAFRDRRGRLEIARGGDIFLDEIGDVPPSIQVKLLRVLETKRFERVGDNTSVPLDARIITATNKNLRRLVEQGLFREDFFFRINVIPVHLPPLRTRKEDIPLLAGHFLRLLWNESHTPEVHLAPDALAACMAYDWPGNVRELRSALEYALVLRDGSVIELKHLPPQLNAQLTAPDPRSTPAGERPDCDDEKSVLIDALRRSRGNKSAAARLLGVSRGTVQNRMRKHGVELQQQIRE